MIKYWLIGISFLLNFTITAQNEVNLSKDVLKDIVGLWEGSLTYLNYQDNKPFTMPANVNIEPGKTDGTLKAQNIYPNEPKANNTYEIVLSEDGKYLNGDLIISVEKTLLGTLVVCSSEGTDDDREAEFKLSYLLGRNNLSMKKEVKFKDGKEWFMRNEFSYSRD